MSTNFLEAIEQPVSRAVLERLFAINPNSWKQYEEKGVFVNCITYKDYMQALVKTWRDRKEQTEARIKLQMEQAEKKRSYRNSDTESGLPKVVEAEKIQKIRLDRAREHEVHLKNLATRGDLIAISELAKIIAPLVGTIANVLKNAADESPDLQPAVDKCFDTLYQIGERLVEQAQQDEHMYVQNMLELPVDFDEVINSVDIEAL